MEFNLTSLFWGLIVNYENKFVAFYNSSVGLTCSTIGLLGHSEISF
jgi:hypothetical protein